jgi:3-hydroxyacyl-[acyl-carrier-protein] dehydratase
MIPHRDPMLLIDHVEDMVPGEQAYGIKYIRPEEHFFPGHFPEKPVMPGVLIIEAMAQTAAVVVVATYGGSADGRLVYFMGIDQARFRRPVLPRDTLKMHVRKLQNRRNVWKFEGSAFVGETLVAEAVFSAMLMDAG